MRQDLTMEPPAAREQDDPRHGTAAVTPAEPRIIPRKEHGISRKQMSPNALRTLYRLHTHGFIAYLVGGCVRDLLLGRTPKDFDVGTNATPGQIRRLFRNCFLVGRRFRLAHLKFEDEIVQVSTFRRAALPSDIVEPEEENQVKRRPWHLKNEDGMVLVDNIFGTPEEDALRRDFTINALAYNIADFSVIDYTTGLADLKQRLIRPIGDPRIRFTEDPVRMLRAVRFAASHAFDIEAAAWEVICELSVTISRASPARLYEEIQKIFLFGSARPAFNLLEKGGLLAALFPGLGHWIYGSVRHMALLEANLAYIDGLYERGSPVSPAFFMAALFGPAIQDMALAHHRNGIPFQQALDAACEAFFKESPRVVTVPGRVTSRVGDILSLQASLHRMPPRRPASIVAKPAFGDALSYLRLGVETRHEHQGCLKWWDTYLLEPPPAAPPDAPLDAPPDKPPAKKRRKKRRFRRRVKKSAS